MSSTTQSPFPLLRYLALILLFAPMLLIALAWSAVVFGGFLSGHDLARANDGTAAGMAIAVALAVTCLMSEWLILPFVIGQNRLRRIRSLVLASTALVMVVTACGALFHPAWIQALREVLSHGL
jgi:hypothetical protein